VGLVQLVAALGTLRSDRRHWYQELLGGLIRLLPAYAAAAFTVKNVGLAGVSEPPAVTAFVDAGFESEVQRRIFQREFQMAPFGDPLSRLAFERFTAQRLDTFTCLRSDLVDDRTWEADAHVREYRKPAGLGDCVFSVHRGNEGGVAYALLACRAAVSDAIEGEADPGESVRTAARFRACQRLMLDTLHRGLEGLYRADEKMHRLIRSADLTPRLRETLEYLLNGDSERHTALKMSLSVHTVHDYVKLLYAHFGVSSRTALLARWIQISGQLPPRRP
jgi:DNA-binding CsgD family transcriptional regulator